jgi:rubrerythrin
VINEEINKLYQPTLDRISEVKNCTLLGWNGSAYYRCSNCGYLADGSKELDRLITIQKFKDKGLSVDDIEN